MLLSIKLQLGTLELFERWFLEKKTNENASFVNDRLNGSFYFKKRLNCFDLMRHCHEAFDWLAPHIFK